ncbi:hypothetical protein EYF80_017533 [Liparis tanakae]|uniref:Uncharacterized protein n=1 Tax=Liparis tanakae TaxID=230148 RepID=A0A4Z2I2E4_9TELE|nr:hypothetical protein EYF80_017533 [Liparis tanakae]
MKNPIIWRAKMTRPPVTCRAALGAALLGNRFDSLVVISRSHSIHLWKHTGPVAAYAKEDLIN